MEQILQAGRVSSWSTMIFLAVGVLYGLLRRGLVRALPAAVRLFP